MKRQLLIFGLSAALSVFTATSRVNAANIINYGETGWGYYQTINDIEYNWQNGNEFNTADYSSFDWTKITKTGQAAYGTAILDGYNTDKSTKRDVKTNSASNTGLALQKTFNLTGRLENALLSFGADNGAVVFINGKKVSGQMAEGYGWKGEYTVNLTSSLFQLGDNKIQILAEDHGSETWADAQLTGNVIPVPEASSIVLGLLSLAGIFRFNRKKS